MSEPEKAAYKLGARKSVADVMGGARNDPAGLQTRLANDNGYAAGKLRGLFGDKAVNSLQAELKNQADMRETNNLALAGSKTAMASHAGGFIPEATPAPRFGGHGGGMGMFAGAELGGRLGEMVGHPDLGGVLGGIAAPIWNAGARVVDGMRQSAAAADRLALGRALTGTPSDKLGEAMARRLQMKQTPSRLTPAARKLSGALMTSGAQMPFAQ